MAELDVTVVLENMRKIIGELSQEIAVLRATIDTLKEPEKK
jgi:hypothetical protein